MRIVAGKFKGRRFSPPAKKYPTRPTTDYAREALFNILNNEFDFQELKALELFGGFGGHSYELVSRGCESITVVEKHFGCVGFMKSTIRDLEVEDYIKVIKGDVFTFLKGSHEKYNYIFADPPYALPTLDLLPEIIFERALLNEDGLFVLEHGKNHTFHLHPHFVKEKEYGGTVFSFFENACQ